MIFAIPVYALVGFVVSPVTQKAEVGVTLERFLSCIAQVEGHKETDLGGRYGLSRITWGDNTTLAYSFSRISEYAEVVAEKHFRWICRTLRDRGYEVNAYTVGGCWRWGVEGFIDRQKYGRVEYAARINNLYHRK